MSASESDSSDNRQREEFRTLKLTDFRKFEKLCSEYRNNYVKEKYVEYVSRLIKKYKSLFPKIKALVSNKIPLEKLNTTRPDFCI